MGKPNNIYEKEGKWYLDAISVEAGDTFVVSSSKKDAIILLPSGIAECTVYEINAGDSQVIKTIRKPMKEYTEDNYIIYNFAVIVDYKNTEDPQAAMYAYSNSVCKIRITY